MQHHLWLAPQRSLFAAAFPLRTGAGSYERQVSSDVPAVSIRPDLAPIWEDSIPDHAERVLIAPC